MNAERVGIISCEQLPVSGGWQCVALWRGMFVRRTYYGYTKREAMRQFRADVPTDWRVTS